MNYFLPDSSFIEIEILLKKINKKTLATSSKSWSANWLF